MSRVSTKEDKWGIPCCVNCIGMHPDEPITAIEIKHRLVNPQKVVAAKLMSFEKKRLAMYANKSCMLCGRSYGSDGNCDETWKMTAKRVHMEFQAVGIIGVSDKDIDRVVATCRKSWLLLWQNRGTIRPVDADKMTFCGRLALIITHALEAREKKNALGGSSSLNKGLLIP